MILRAKAITSSAAITADSPVMYATVPVTSQLDEVSALAASVISVDSCLNETTLAVRCTDSNALACVSASDAEVTIVNGSPWSYVALHSASMSGAELSAVQRCTTSGVYYARNGFGCEFAATIIVDELTITSTYGGLYGSTKPAFAGWGQIPITAGTEKLRPTIKVCSSQASTSSTAGAMAAPTASYDILKVMIPIGAALAGALA
ncbi:hypothetical protein Slin15195_G125660 [Septoria linicola]|uniref:Uncharacterized protein n=1 Tax=Septoria linicola TaxID=215465 RepID=A0A9Q9B8H6_9PEZI|nr:hypothetical protein Slin14017_G081840 [Septoria linicola]USW59247.1 hypothetical protein Slin15195_G125660 [Septoria linicola]